jgi:nucleotidyltransferase/DNA polymerase involved in DNA repair
MEVYVDDMLVKSVQPLNHTEDLQEAFKTLNQYGMKLNPAKCAFGVSSRKFLGYMVSNRGIEANPEKIQAVLDVQSPKNMKQLQQLTGRIVALNQFISRSIRQVPSIFQNFEKGLHMVR